jgi:phosphohistidine phosphatase
VDSARVLWVLRHAKARQRPPAGGGDHERVLAPRGRRDADALGRRLGDDGDHLGLAADVLPGLVLCSTAARAVETAERVLANMAAPPPVTYLGSLYEASPQGVLEQVATTADNVSSVMVVGHNPTFEALVGALPREPVRSLADGFATCGLVVFSLPVGRWDEVVPETAGVLGVFFPPF